MRARATTFALPFAVAALFAASAWPVIAHAEEEGLDVRSDPPPKLAPGSVKIFDTRLTRYATALSGGPIWYRSVHDDFSGLRSGVFEARLGQTQQTPRFPFFLAAYRWIDFRMFDDKSFALSFIHEIGAGVALGPIEPEVRTGFHLLDLDVFHGGYSASLLSPRVSAGGAINLGKFRLDISAYSEYLWRWFGPSYYVRGVMIGAALDTTPPSQVFGPDQESTF
jgi:hypothetical protein